MSGVATAANQTGGTQKTQVVDGSGNVVGSTSNALNVNIASSAITGSNNIAQVGGNTVVTAGVNGTLAVGGNQAAGSNISSNTNPALIGGSDYGATAKLQTLKVDSSGNAQVAITNTPSVSISGTPTVTANVGTTNGLALDATLTGGNAKIQGNIASGSSDAGNPVKVGAVYNSSTPTPSTGQRVDLQADASGNLKTNVTNTVTVSGTVTTSPPSNASINVNQVAGGAVTNAGQTGALQVGGAVATNNTVSSATNPLLIAGSDYGGTPKIQTMKVDSSGNAQVAVTNTPSVTVSGTVSTAPAANSSVNLNQVGGSAVATAATGIAKVGLTDGSGTALNSTSNALNVNMQNSTVAVTESGTWTVQPGNTANTTPWLVSLNPSTAGGWSVSSQTALTNTAVSVKGSAGQFGGYMFFNPNAAAAYIQVYNATSATPGTTTPTYVIALPGNAAANIEMANGIAHSTGIMVTATTTPTGGTAPTSSLVGFVLYK